MLLMAAYVLWSAVFSFRESRNAPYHTIRRNAIRAAMRQIGIFIVLLGAAVGIFIARQNASPDVNLGSLAFAEPEPLPTFTSTPVPDLPPTITPQPEATATLTPTAINPPQTSPTVAATNASTTSIDIYEVSSSITNNLLPAGAGTQFDAGLTRIYFWLEYSDMQDGDSWRQVLLINGETILDDELAWDQGEEGTAYYFLDAPDGWPSGNYEIRIFTSDRMNDAIRFSLQ